MAQRLGPLKPGLRTVGVAPVAQRQIDGLLRYSAGKFGEAAAERYRTLIAAAIELLARYPSHPAATPAPVRRTVWMLHLRHVSRGMPAGSRVVSPRHLIVHRFTERRLDIVQVLDDRMDLPRRLR